MTSTGPKAAKVFSYSVQEQAAKNVAATIKQQEALRGLSAEYTKLAAAAERGSAVQIAASTRLAAANKKLGIETITAGQAFDTFTRKAASLGKTMTMYVTAPIAIAAAAATKMFIDFQRHMEQIHTQAGATQAEVNKLTPQVLNYAIQSGGSPIGPNDLSQGLYHLESLGLRGSKAMDALKISSQAAGLGIANLESVSTALGGAVVTDIKGTQNYNEAMGTLNATIGAGNMRMQDLTAALSTGVLPAAKAAGLSLPEVGAALAVLTDRGMGAQMAATRLRMTFAMMQDPTKAATQALDALGIKQFQLATLLKSGPDGLLKALELIQAAIDRSKDKTTAYAEVLQAFGKGRSSAGILTLLNSLSSATSSFQGKLAQIQAQQNSFAEAVAAYHKTAAYQISHAWAAVQASLIKIGATLAPAAAALANGLSRVISGFTQLGPVTKSTIGVITLVFAGLGPILFILGKIGRAWLEMGAIVKSVGQIIAAKSAQEVAENNAVATSVERVNGGYLLTKTRAEEAAGTVEASAAAETTAIEGTNVAAGALLGTLQMIAALGIITVTIDMIKRWINAGDQTDVTKDVVNSGPIDLGQIRRQAFGKLFGGGGGAANVYYNPDTKKFEAQGAYGTMNGPVVLDKTITKAQAAAALGISVKKLNMLMNMSKYGSANDVYPPDFSNHPGVQGPGSARSIGDVKAAWINAASAHAGISATALRAILMQETGGHWDINPDSGATGYGQIMPGTGRGMPYNYRDPRGNVMDSAILLAGAVKKYGSYAKAFASYYGGAYGARVYGTPAGDVRQGGGKYPSVNEYVNSVMSKMGSNVPINAYNNPMAGDLHNPVNTAAAAAAKKKAAELKKKLAAAKKAADEAAKGVIDPAIQTVDEIKTAVNAAIKSGKSPSAIIKLFRKDIKTYQDQLTKLESEYDKGSKEEKSKLAPAIARLKNGLKMAQAGLAKELGELANVAAKAESQLMLSNYQTFHDQVDKLTKLHQFTIPGINTDYTAAISKELNTEVTTLGNEISKVTRQLKSAHGAQKTTLQNLLNTLKSDLNDVNNEIESNLEDKISQMQSLYDSAKSKFETSFGNLVSTVQAQFEQQTQDYINNVLGPMYYQGSQTPLEKQLADLQAQDSSESLATTLSDAKVQLANDIIGYADNGTILRDKQSVIQAQRAIQEADLAQRATAERAQADKNYASAEEQYTRDRTVQEDKMNAALADLETGIENGTASLSDLQPILDQYGVSVQGNTLYSYELSIAMGDQGGMLTALKNLQAAFNALADWLDKMTGTSSGQRGGPAGTTFAIGGNTYANLPGGGVSLVSGDVRDAERLAMATGQFIAMADGGIVTKPTLAMIAEAGEPEAVIPLSQLNGGGSGEIHIHFDGPVIGSDLRKAAKDLEPHIRSALYRTQRQNVDLKLT